MQRLQLIPDFLQFPFVSHLIMSLPLFQSHKLNFALFFNLTNLITCLSSMFDCYLIFSIFHVLWHLSETSFIGRPIWFSFLLWLFYLLQQIFFLRLEGPQIWCHSCSQIVPFSFHISESFIELIISGVCSRLVTIKMISKFLNDILLLSDELLFLVKLLFPK